MASTSSRDGGIVGVVWRSTATGGEAVADDDGLPNFFSPGIGNKSARFYAMGGTLGTNVPSNNGDMKLHPIIFNKDCAIDRIGLEVTSAGAAGSVLRLGIYRDDGTGYPSTLLADFTARDSVSIDGTSATVQSLTIASLSVSAGLYWIGFAAQGAPATQPTIRSYVSLGVASSFSTSAPTSNQAANGWLEASVTGALPSSFSSTTITGSPARMFVRVT